MAKTSWALDLTHYRTSDATYFDCDLWDCHEMRALPHFDYLVWHRLVGGPENKTRAGVQLEGFDSHYKDNPELDFDNALTRLESIGLIELRDDRARVTFPTVVYGELPPGWED